MVSDSILYSCPEKYIVDTLLPRAMLVEVWEDFGWFHHHVALGAALLLLR